MIPNKDFPQSSKRNLNFRKLINTFYKLKVKPGSDSEFQTVKSFHRRGSIKLQDPIVLKERTENEYGFLYDLTDSAGFGLTIFFSHRYPKYGCGNYKDHWFFVRRSDIIRPTLYLVFVKGPSGFPHLLYQCFADGDFNQAMRDIINRRKMQ